MLLNDCREVFSVALKKHGWSNNSTDPAQAEAAFKDLKQLNSSVIDLRYRKPETKVYC